MYLNVIQCLAKMAVNSKEHTGWTYFVDNGNQKSFS